MKNRVGIIIMLNRLYYYLLSLNHHRIHFQHRVSYLQNRVGLTKHRVISIGDRVQSFFS